MVYYKRKPVTYVPFPRGLNKDAELWMMKETGEGFLAYEAYIMRLEYYMKKKFTCEITGHTNLTFFDALKSETQGSIDVDIMFNDHLREPVLRRVQFSQISRIDELVNSLYETFKEDFFPGEHVTVHIDDTNERLEGVIRDKASFPEIRNSNGTVDREAMSRYFVTLDDMPGQEALVDNKHMFRERKSFTKQVLRSFLRNTVTRDRFEGAPWLVKEHIARTYNIDTTLPARLQYDAIMAEKKAQAALRKGKVSEEYLQLLHDQGNFEALRPALKAHKGKLSNKELAKYQESLGGNIPPFNAKPMTPARPKFSFSKNVSDDTPDSQDSFGHTTIKYPIEDLEVHPKDDVTRRPELKFWSQVAFEQDSRFSAGEEGLKPETIGPLLEIWNTLNVHAEVFLLDSFTFDDFAQAMQFSSADMECELFDEVHCAVLKMLVNQNGDVAVDLPRVDDEDEEEEDEDEDEEDEDDAGDEEETTAEDSKVSSPGPEALNGANGHVTPDAEDLGAKEATHNARGVLGETGWIERLSKRDFKNGGWQAIMVGLLDRVSRPVSDPDDRRPSYDRNKRICDRILSHLAPLDEEASQHTARDNYSTLDVNLRVQALQIATVLAVGTKAIKEYMEQCSLEMTRFRKQKIEKQKERKQLVANFQELDQERKLLLPDDVPDKTENGVHEDPEALDLQNENVETEQDDEEGAPHKGRLSRRGNDRSNELKRKRKEEQEAKKAAKEKKKAKLEKKQITAYDKKVEEINEKKEEIRECEEEIAELDERLRENNCQRTKCLGRDRFWNRYYWFERNAMPYGGVQDSSTAEYGYANGRVWVQGPDDIERNGYIDLEEPEVSEYRLAYGMSVKERKEVEEGPTHLNNAQDWGYIDSAEALDALIAWLDERGNREKDLRKELLIWQVKVAEYMGYMNEHLSENAAKQTNLEEPQLGIATRRKVTQDQTYIKFPCLYWHNTSAMRELGHLHSVGLPPKRNVKPVKGRQVNGAASSSTRSGRTVPIR